MLFTPLVRTKEPEIMKRLLQQSTLACMLLFAAAGAKAQEVDNINNRYGPPNYSGGTVASPSESFALYHQQTVNARRAVSATTAISEVYPNPAATYTRIILAGVTTETTTVSIVNFNGVLVRSYEYGAGASRFDIDISSLPDGLYALQVQERGKEAQSIQLSKSRE